MTRMNNLPVFLNHRYWLNPAPVPLGPSLVGGFVFFLAWFLLAAIALYIAAYVVRKSGDKLKAKALHGFGSALMKTGLLGYLILLFAYEQLPILGMRLWALFWLGLFCWWIAKAVRFAVAEYPARRNNLERLKEMRKYFPGKKK